MAEQKSGRFALVINSYDSDNKVTRLETQIVNEGVPVEMVLMLVKSFLKTEEKRYIDDYKKSTSDF